jgi:hypothetical protein
MTPDKLLAVAVRVFALYFGLTGVRDIATTVARYENGIDLLSGSVIAGLLIIFTLITIVLWKFPLTIAQAIYPKATENTPNPWNQDEVYVAGFVVLGVYFLAEAVTNFARWAMLLIAIYRADGGFDQLDTYQKVSIALLVIQFGISLSLIFGATGLKNFIFRFRYGRPYNDDL